MMHADNINTDSEKISIELKNKKTVFSGFSEDVWAVCIGGLLIVIILAGVVLFKDIELTQPVYQWVNGNDLLSKVLTQSNLLVFTVICIVFLLLSLGAVTTSVNRSTSYIGGFGVIFILAIISLIIAGNKSISYYGIEYVIFALLIGLLLGNLFRLPVWVKESARSELFIKTGLIILGTSILFTDIIKAGLPGILQSILVVAAVWFFALWLCRRLKVDDEFGVILASAVSICGVSAAIVASGAIKGDKKKLSYVTTLVLLVALPMLIVLPWLIRQFGIPEIVGGAWLGGTLDTTASVTAASELVGPVATKAGVIVKFSQNVLIGVAAFLIAAWWVFKKTAVTGNREKPALRLIWERFPKFVLGFIAASLIFSFWIPTDMGNQVSGILNSLRTIWFALAFVSIGLEANFSDLFRMQEGRPALAFIVAQVFNIIWTLLWAYLLFGGMIFPSPDIR
ncbi:MAG TPA: putative sulfate exporter family transporter [Chitinophagaceae bacterium]|nr:putative sulfate exporter family transporter [Chitinophagaceae bacterium]